MSFTLNNKEYIFHNYNFFCRRIQYNVLLQQQVDRRFGKVGPVFPRRLFCLGPFQSDGVYCFEHTDGLDLWYVYCMAGCPDIQRALQEWTEDTGTI